MEEINKFNIRVYAILIHQNSLLILKEPYAGEILYKFPGGGLEFGEGTIDCLKRELKEELNLEIKTYKHFYTQEKFVQSKFRENEQILTIYYKVEIENLEDIQDLENRLEINWIPLKDLNPNHVNLPVDKLVIKHLLAII